MVDKVKVINFLQDFGCARLEQLRILFNDKDSNFKYILDNNLVSKKGDIFVHNTTDIDERMLIALDLLCLFKPKYGTYCTGDEPALITFFTKDNMKYHIIVVDENNKQGIIKMLNNNPCAITGADKLIVAFPDDTEKENIECDIPVLYAVYPELEIID